MTSVLKGKPGSSRIVSPRPTKITRTVKQGNDNTSTTRSMTRMK